MAIPATLPDLTGSYLQHRETGINLGVFMALFNFTLSQKKTVALKLLGAAESTRMGQVGI